MTILSILGPVTTGNDQGATRPPDQRISNRPRKGETIIQAVLTLSQRDKFRLLGGQHWLQMMIDAALRQPKVYTSEDQIMSMLMPAVIYRRPRPNPVDDESGKKGQSAESL